MRPELVSDVISGVNVGQVGMNVPENFVILSQTVLEIYSCEAVGCGIFGPFLNVDTSNQYSFNIDLTERKPTGSI